jgi:hypothetical protein
MRFSTCAAAITTATLFMSSAANPTPKLKESRGHKPGNKIQQKKEKSDNKYFHEPGSDNTLGHYDKRYFHGVVTDEERTDTQSHMVRAYLNFFREKELDTWIAHGTLLGWWWNGKVRLIPRRHEHE